VRGVIYVGRDREIGIRARSLNFVSNELRDGSGVVATCMYTPGEWRKDGRSLVLSGGYGLVKPAFSVNIRNSLEG
jgi:hypothetical protein